MDRKWSFEGSIEMSEEQRDQLMGMVMGHVSPLLVTLTAKDGSKIEGYDKESTDQVVAHLIQKTGEAKLWRLFFELDLMLWYELAGGMRRGVYEKGSVDRVLKQLREAKP